MKKKRKDNIIIIIVINGFCAIFKKRTHPVSNQICFLLSAAVFTLLKRCDQEENCLISKEDSSSFVSSSSSDAKW